MLTVFYFHNARFFDFVEDWSVKNADKSLGMSIFMVFVHLWIMPLFFVLAGAGTCFSLRARTAAQYVTERLHRLVVPYFVGLVLVVPPQAYCEQASKSLFDGSFFQYYPRFFHDFRIGWEFPGLPAFHLWFLRFLFLYSLVALPVFFYLKGERGQRVIPTLARLCQWRGGIGLIVLPIAAIQLALRARFHDYGDWADTVYWFAFFVFGFVFFTDASFIQAMVRNGIAALVLGILSFLALMGLYASGRLEEWLQNPSYSPGYLFVQVVMTMDTCAWLIFILSLGPRFLNFRNNLLRYCNEAVLPFYVLHQTVIIVIGFYVVQWQVGIPVKYVVISTASLGATIGIYDLLIRRTNVTRFLFGMKPKRRPVSDPAVSVKST